MGDAETDRLAAEFEDERPSRLLSGRIDVVVNIWCFLVALFVLKQVFWPLDLGNQYYLILFLGIDASAHLPVLPVPGEPSGPGRPHERGQRRHRRTTIRPRSTGSSPW